MLEKSTEERRERRHTSTQYEQELTELRQKLLRMGGYVEEMIFRTMQALVERDSELARQMIEFDHQINRLEVEIDELCLHILALRQPTASDLRFLSTAMKIVTDLERIADLGTSIAERAIELNEEPQLKPYIDLPRMAEAAQKMVHDCLDAFVERNVELAESVLRHDHVVDELNEQIFRELLTFMLEDPHNITRAMRLMFVSKALERIGDHATNIAEMVIFMVKGKIIRHMGKNAPPDTTPSA
ncbi:MAG: phosphate transport system regulatory protein PhoU [Nitrospinota bacterium]|nr:MAG: phosphate transport system regulatory protein PhoU [Nitrospinota bacterium]